MANRYDSNSTFVGPTPQAENGQWRPLEPGRDMAHAPLATTAPAQAITIDNGAKSFGSLQGSYTDHQTALQRKFLVVLAVEGVTIAGLLLLAWLQVRSHGLLFPPFWLVLTGIAGLVTFVVMDRTEHAHTPAGVERQRNQLAADVATDSHTATVGAWRDVEMRRIDAYYDYLERSDNRRYEQLTERRSLPQRD